MKRRDAEVWFGLNPREEPRASGYVARIRWDDRRELHDARFLFEGGWAKPAETTHTLVWFRSPEAALAGVVPTVRFDVLDGDKVVATGEVIEK